MVFKAQKWGKGSADWGKGAAEWGKGKSKKGKDKSWAEPQTSWWGSETWSEAGAASASAAPGGYTRRLLARDFAPKKILRSYAAPDGKIFYGDGTDLEMLEKDKLRAWLTADTSELSRRPCWGISMAGKSVAGMASALDSSGPASSRKELVKLLATKQGAAALAGLKDLEYDVHRHDPEALQKKFLAIFQFFKEQKKDLHELLPRIAVNAAQQYLGAAHALDILVKANALGAWAQQIPDEEHLQPYLDQFRGDKATPETAARFLVGAYKARKRFEAAWKRAAPGAMRGDESDDSNANKHRSHQPAASSDSASAAKKRKKAAKKKSKKSSSSSTPSRASARKEKKHKKDKKETKKRARSSSSSSSAAKKKASNGLDAKKWSEIDEGQTLEVEGEAHNNCCLPLALGRAKLGRDASKAAVRHWAAAWVARLPAEQQSACRVDVNEAKLGEGLYDDYVDFERAAEPEANKIILVVWTRRRTRPGRGPQMGQPWKTRP